MNISKIAKIVRPSSTLSLSSLAQKKREQGIDVINFSAGEPDFNTPENIREAAINAIDNNFTKYTAYEGIYELRQAVAESLNDKIGVNYTADNIIISNGSKQALFNTFTAILDYGDEVIVPAPYWNSYIDMIYIAGGKPTVVKTKKQNSFKITFEELENAYTDKTKAVIINSPNNPTGMVYSEEELQVIADFANSKDIYVVSDEIYYKMIYSRKLKHISIASLGDDIYGRTIVIGGFSKSYSMTGWRVGFAASANIELVNAMGNIQSNTTSNVNSIAQMAALEAVQCDQECVDKMLKEFQHRRDFISQRISDIPLLSSLLPKGAFYLFVDVSKLLGSKVKGVNLETSADVAKLLLEYYNVVVVPSDAFGYDNYIRISYATSMRDIVEGCNRIEKFVKENY